MEITRQPSDQGLELKLTGRLDAYWSDQLSAAIEEATRQGSHHIQLNMAGVVYLSSAGIRVLLKYFKQLKEIQGSLTVLNPSETAFSILELAGLSNLLIKSGPASPPAPVVSTEPTRTETEGTVYYTYVESKGASLHCKLVGNPEKIKTGNFTENDGASISFPESTFGLGVGAFGTSFDDCKDRFGEFLAVAGVAAYLPSDDTNVPDYVISEGLLVPEMEVLYGLTLDGEFSHLIRFEAKPEPPGIVGISEVIETAINATGADTAGFIMVAESAGLVGATLKQSPARATGGESPLEYPAVREWISFTAERAFDRALCVIVGVASKRTDLPYQTVLRPVGKGSRLLGHFHAAIFPYSPVQRGRIELFKTVNGMFSTATLQSLMHLLADDRELDGVGESELLRGACWVSPVTHPA